MAKYNNMVLIINLNFAIDKTAVVHSLDRGDIYRLDDVLTLPGGKGVNVARTLKTLGISSTLMGFTGGYTGRWIERSMVQGGFKFITIRHDGGESRICYSIVDRNGVSTDFNEEGPVISQKFQDKFLEKFGKIVKRFKIVVVCGRTVRGLKRGFYKTIVKIAKKNKAVVAFDTSGWPLEEGINSGCDIVKINKYEFEEVSHLKFTKSSLLKYFNIMRKNGLRILAVTNGSSASYAAFDGRLWKYYPVRLKNFTSPVGAGDSFMAGIIAGCLRKYPIESILKLALGCAASDCLSIGAGIIKYSEVLKFADKIEVSAV